METSSIIHPQILWGSLTKWDCNWREIYSSQGHVGKLMEKQNKHNRKNRTERGESESLHGGIKRCQKAEQTSNFKVIIAYHVYPSLPFIFNSFLLCLTVLVHLIYLGKNFREIKHCRVEALPRRFWSHWLPFQRQPHILNWSHVFPKQAFIPWYICMYKMYHCFSCFLNFL